MTSTTSPGASGLPVQAIRRLIDDRVHLERRLRVDATIRAIVVHVASAEPEDLDGAITSSLAELGMLEDVDRAYVQVFSDDCSLVFTTHEWTADGIEQQIELVQGYRTAEFPYSFRILSSLQVWDEPDVDAMGPEAAKERWSFGRFGVRSILQVPLVDRGSLFGVIGFNTSRSARTWSQETIDMLATVGEVIGSVLARRRVADEVQAVKEDAERANRAKSEFLARMSHELRTPLNAVLGFADLMLIEDRSETDREHLGLIVAGATQLLALIEEVLDISRIETGHLHVTSSAVAVGALAREVTELLGPMATAAGVTVVVGEALDALVVRADRQRLQQVVTNLVSNAIKYNRPGGSVTVTGGVDEGDGFVEIADTGVGIAADAMGRLFQPFDRLGAERTAVKGTGVGLALTRRLVEVMGGTIAIRSAVDVGTTATVTLPLAQPAGAGVAADGRGAARDSGRVRVLLVDANAQRRAEFEAMCEDGAGVVGVAVDRAEAAFELARSWGPHLVLLDVETADLATEPFVRRLRMVEREPATLAYLADSAGPRLVERIVHLGALALQARPLDRARLGGLVALVASRPTR